MGKIVDLFNGITLPQQARRQLLLADQEHSVLQAKAQVLESENLKLQAEVNPLKRKVELLEQKISHLTSSSEIILTFNQATGTHVDPSTGIHYCTRCLSDTKRSPLKNETHGWRCMVCKKFFQDPDRPQPLIESWQPADPGMGM